MLYSRLDESKDNIRLITLLPKALRSNIVRCKLETRSLASLNPEYEDFLSNSDASILSRRRVIAEWSRSRCPAEQGLVPGGDPMHNRVPTAACYRFMWGDYAALSYVWGDEGKISRIIVNGQETEVTQNLEEALRAFRDGREFETGFKLWVDAICINQKDYEERGRQIRRMRDIYGNAWTVIAWLGGEGDESDKAIRLVRDLSIFSSKNRVTELEPRLRLEPGYLGQGCWLALHEFMNRPFWFRLWIIQEIVMGSSAVVIRCGKSSIDWASFCAGIAFLQEHLWQVKDELLQRDIAKQKLGNHPVWSTASLHLVYQDLSALSQFEESGGDRLSFGRILDIANSADCQDPRDKVYGLVGIMDPCVGQQLSPDYTLEPSKIYAAVSRAFIRIYCNLEPIREGNPWGPTGTPTWAADWRWNGRIRWARTENHIPGPFWLPEKLGTSTVVVHLPYQASGISSQEALFSDDGLLMTCRGFVIDSVSGLSAGGNGYFSWSKSSIIQPDQWRSIYGDASDTAETLYRALVANRVGHGQKASERHAALLNLPSTFSAAYPQFKRLGWVWLSAQEGYYFRWQEWRSANCDFWLGDRRLDDYFTDDIPVGASEYDYSEVYTCFNRTCKRRRLMTTEKGYIGWAPDNIFGRSCEQTRQGDLIAIIFGCSTPIVIRPYGQLFKVVGEAYVQGLMDGEAMGLLEAGRFRAQNFTFC